MHENDPLDIGVIAMNRDSINPIGRKVREIIQYGIDHPIHDISKAWQFVCDSYDGSSQSPNRSDWTADEILEFVAEYHVDGLAAVRLPITNNR